MPICGAAMPMLPRRRRRTPLPRPPGVGDHGGNGKGIAPSSALGPLLRLPRGTDHPQRRQARRATPHRQPRAEALDLEETLDFLAASRKDPLYAAFVLVIAMGLRRGEIVGLRWSDLDLDDRVLYVRQQTQRRRGVLYDDDPKSRRRRGRPALCALHRAPALTPVAAGSCPREGGGEVAGVGLCLHHPHRPPGRAAQPVPLLHPHRPVRRPPRHPAARRPARHRDPSHRGRSRAPRRDVYTHVVQDTQREAMGHMDRLLRRRPGRQ